METDTDLNFSSSEFFNFSNSTVGPTQYVAFKESFKWTDEEIARLIQIVVRPMLM